MFKHLTTLISLDISDLQLILFISDDIVILSYNLYFILLVFKRYKKYICITTIGWQNIFKFILINTWILYSKSIFHLLYYLNLCIIMACINVSYLISEPLRYSELVHMHCWEMLP